MGIFPQQKLCRLYGITLIELLIVLAISGILFASAGPAFSTLIGRTAVTTAVNDMVGRLHLARSEAITRRVKVTLCPSDDNITCLKTTEWHHGFIIFSNENGNGVIDGEDQLLRIYQPAAAGWEYTQHRGAKSSLTNRTAAPVEAMPPLLYVTQAENYLLAMLSSPEPAVLGHPRPSPMAAQ